MTLLIAEIRGLHYFVIPTERSDEGAQIFLDRSTNLRVSECMEVHLHTKQAKADSTKLKGHKAFAKTKLSLFGKRDERSGGSSDTHPFHPDRAQQLGTSAPINIH